MATFATRVMRDFQRAGYGRFAVSAAGLTAHAVSTVTGALTGAIGSAAASEATYAANRQLTNHIPDIANAAAALWSGYVPSWLFTDICANNGVKWDPGADAAGNKWTYAWSQIIKAGQPMLDVSTTLDLWRSGYIDDLEVRLRLGKHGLTRAGDRELLMRDKGWFDLGTATDLWHQGVLPDWLYEERVLRSGIGNDAARGFLMGQTAVAPLGVYEGWWQSGWIDDNAYRRRLSRDGISNAEEQERFLRMRNQVDLSQTRADYWMGQAPEGETVRRLSLLGYGTEEERRVVLQAQAPFAPAEALALYYRGEIDGGVLRGAAGAAGMTGQAQYEQWFRGSRPIPAPADIITFAVHDVWDNAVVDRLGYDLEFPPELSYWMAVQGWDWGEGGTSAQPAPPNQVNWPVAYWRSHWRPITEAMATEMFHRLRPGRMDRYQAQVPGVQAFTLADYERSIKILDYSKTNRQWLEAIGFRQLPINSARLLYRTKQRDRQWLIDVALDYGYVLDDARAIVDAEDARLLAAQQRQADAMARKVRQQTVDELGRGYTLGTLTIPYVVDSLGKLGIEPDLATAWIQTLAARENHHVVEESIKRLRSAYLSGEFAPTELVGRLGQLGLMADSIQRYVARWTLQRTQSRRMLTSEKIVHYVATGRMTVQVATARLTNLGWTAPDMLLMLAEAQAKAAELEAKSVKAEELAAGKRQRALEANRKRALKVVTDAEAHLRKLTPVGMLKRLVCEAIVSPGWAGARLLAMGYDPDTVDLYIKDWAAVNSANKKCLPPKDDAALPAAPNAIGAPPQATSGKMTLAGQAIPVGGVVQTMTPTVPQKQGNP